MTEETKTTKRPWLKPFTRLVVLIILIGLWGGIPAFNKWRADSMVDELCAKDGGTKIHEVIRLPAEKFNTYWLVNLPSIEHAKADADYYLISTTRDIQGNSGSSHVNDLAIWRTKNKIVRKADEKVMAELVSYTRRGGDSIGPWHPSHYTCPTNGFSHDVFIKQ